MTYGVMESEELTVLPWYSGRLEYTAGNQMAETEKGYYMYYSNRLIYADKADLSSWVPVCGDPACDHSTPLDCAAVTSGFHFIIKDGRIYREKQRTANLAPGRGGTIVLVSTARNGSDIRLEHDLTEAAMTSHSTVSTLLFPEYWIYSMDELDQNGENRSLFFYVSNGTEEKLADFTSENEYAGIFCARDWYRLLGDRYFYCRHFGENICRFHNGELEKIDLSLVPESGGCIMGSTLRSFQRSNGYYDTDISTGENWRNVALPEELLHADAGSYISITGVSSDSIFFMLRNEKDYTYSQQELSVLYRILLDKKELTCRRKEAGQLFYVTNYRSCVILSREKLSFSVILYRYCFIFCLKNMIST